MKRTRKTLVLVLLICIFVLSSGIANATLQAEGLAGQIIFNGYEDFEGKEGEFPDKTDKAPSGWEYRLYGGTASSVIKSGENSYLQMKGFSALKYNNQIDKPYVFSVDYTASGTTKAGIFARAGQESFRVHDGTRYWATDYYEDDRSDGDHIGSSGFYIQPLGLNLRIVLKQYIDNNMLKPISNTNINIITYVDFSTGLHKITIVDYGDSINIYLDDNTGDNYTAKITFSNVKTYKKLDKDNVTIIDSEEYYSNVSVTNAKGDNLASINNGLISTKSCISIANRNSTASIDNLRLTTYSIEEDTNPPTADTTVLVGVLLAFVMCACVIFRKKKVYNF